MNKPLNKVGQARRAQQWVAGDVKSWVLGVALGGLLGTVLLIGTPMLLRGSTPAPAPAEGAATATAEPTDTETTEAAPAANALVGDAEAGKAVYAGCAGCHGAEGQGGIGLPLNTPDGAMSWTPEQFKLALHTGKAPTRQLAPTMPLQPQLNDQQLADLQAFLKTLN